MLLYQVTALAHYCCSRSQVTFRSVRQNLWQIWQITGEGHPSSPRDLTSPNLTYTSKFTLRYVRYHNITQSSQNLPMFANCILWLQERETSVHCPRILYRLSLTTPLFKTKNGELKQRRTLKGERIKKNKASESRVQDNSCWNLSRFGCIRSTKDDVIPRGENSVLFPHNKWLVGFMPCICCATSLCLDFRSVWGEVLCHPSFTSSHREGHPTASSTRSCQGLHGMSWRGVSPTIFALIS